MVYYMLLVDILLIECIFLHSYEAWKNTMQLKKKSLHIMC